MSQPIFDQIKGAIGADGWSTDVLIALEVAKQRLLKQKGIEL